MTDSSLANKKIAVYARYSSNLQNCASIDDQLFRCRKYIEDRGGLFNSAHVYSDSATSGASLQRAGFEQLMRGVHGGTVDTIVVEDMSRVSRDMADSATLYRELEYLGVRMIGVGDGIDTSTKGSKLSFNVKAMMSDFYLEDLRDKTLRGLEGRARQGMSTGGLPYGYTSQPVLDEFGKSRGSRVLVDEEQALVIQRIYQMYIDGYSFSDIAGALNEAQIPPPRAKSRHRKKGWVASSIRNILENEAYIGRWSFKKRQWRKIPGTNTRRYKKRPESEIMREVYEVRRIVPSDVWGAVQTRRAEVRAKYKRGPDAGAPGRRNTYPLSGLLRCGHCGAPMVVTRGSSASYYTCGDAKSRRTCKNRSTVREDVARRSIFNTLEEQFTSPEAIAFLRKAIVGHLRSLGDTANAELEERQGRRQRTLDRLAHLIEFIASGNVSPTISATITDLEAQAKQDEDAMAALKSRAKQPVVLPTPDAVLQKGLQLREILDSEPLRAREHLRHLFRGEGIKMTPQPDGSYVGEGQYFPLVAFAELSATKLQRPGGGAPGRGTAVSCAGWI